MIRYDIYGSDLHEAVNLMTGEDSDRDVLAFDIMSNHCDLLIGGCEYQLHIDFDYERRLIRMRGDVETCWTDSPEDIRSILSCFIWGDLYNLPASDGKPVTRYSDRLDYDINRYDEEEEEQECQK